MTMELSIHRFRAAVDQLWSAMGELAIIALEDQPESPALAAADHLAEEVSELQGELACARTLLSGKDGRVSSGLPEVFVLLAQFDRRLDRGVRSHEAVERLAAAASRAGREWPAWHRSVLDSADRLDAPRDDVTIALADCLREVCVRPHALQSAPGGWETARPQSIEEVNRPRRTP